MNRMPSSVRTTCQPPRFHRVVDDLGQSVGAALPGRPAVVLPESLGETVNGRLERRSAFAIEHTRDVVHAARLADLEKAVLPIIFDPVIEAFGINHVARVIGQPGNLFDRRPLRLLDPPLRIHVLAQVFAQLFAELADDRRRLVTDRAQAEGLRHRRHRLQLLADGEAVAGRGAGEPAGAGHPGARALAGEQMVAALLRRRQDPAELALEPVDDGAQTARIDEIVVGVAVEIGDRTLETFELNRHAELYELSLDMSKADL